MAGQRSTWLTIVAVLLAEVAAALLLAFVVAQAYTAYECDDPAYKQQHRSRCQGGVPYPLF
jgi:hypothetical protein